MPESVNRALQSRAPLILRLLLAAMAGILFALPGLAAQYARGRLIPELRLKNGTVLHDVTVTSVGSTTVMARWDGGMGSLLLMQLPDEMRADLTPVAAVKPPAPAADAPAAVDPKLATAELPTDIKLTNGFVMHQSTVTRWDKTSVLVAYPGGVVPVRFQNIAPEQRAIFEAHKDEALANQAKADAATMTEQDSAAARDEQASQEKAAADREVADQKAEEIQNGVSLHYLVKGMTKEQVIQAFGKPPDSSGETFSYILRGHDKYGNAADRTATFKDGVLVGWRDARDGEPNGAVDH